MIGMYLSKFGYPNQEENIHDTCQSKIKDKSKDDINNILKIVE